jgi:hypothetical protein
VAVLPVEAVLRVYASTRFLLAISAARLALIVAFIGSAITWLGLRGAVLVTLGAAAVAKVAGLVRVAPLMHTPLARLLPWRDFLGIGLASAAAALLAVVLRGAVPGGVLPRLVVAALVCTAGYVALVFQCGLVTEDEKRALWARLFRWPLLATATRSS